MGFPDQKGGKPVDTTAMDIAKADSKDCPFCLGEGVMTVYAPKYDGCETQFDAKGFVYVARTTAHCRCPLGRLIRSATKDDVRRRIPDVQAIERGESMWLPFDPTEKPLVNSKGKPVDETEKVSTEDFRAFWRRIRVSRVAKPVP